MEKKKRFSGTTDYSVHIRTQIILIRCTSLLAPKIMPLLLNSDFIVRFILVRFVIVTKGNRI